MSTRKPKPEAEVQQDDTSREAQKSHGSQQNRSKKDGHPTQVGSGQDQQSNRTRGRGGNQP